MIRRRRLVRTWGASLTRLREGLAACAQRSVSRAGEDRALDPTPVTRAVVPEGAGGITIALSVCGRAHHDLERILDREVERIESGLGAAVVSTDGRSLEEVVIMAASARGLRIATAESVTGGGVGVRLTGVDGASTVYRGGVIAYDPAIKFSLLGVPPGPVVTASTARNMALGVARLLEADVGLATTGVAGREPQEGYPQGSVFLGLSLRGEADARFVRFSGDRETIRTHAVSELLDWLRRRLQAPTRAR